MSDLIDRAIRQASRPLPFKSTKQQNAILEHAADDLADAYRIGAEEAQREIILRLQALKVIVKAKAEQN